MEEHPQKTQKGLGQAGAGNLERGARLRKGDLNRGTKEEQSRDIGTRDKQPAMGD
jgi:hypothetical protein